MLRHCQSFLPLPFTNQPFLYLAFVSRAMNLYAELEKYIKNRSSHADRFDSLSSKILFPVFFKPHGDVVCQYTWNGIPNKLVGITGRHRF